MSLSCGHKLIHSYCHLHKSWMDRQEFRSCQIDSITNDVFGCLHQIEGNLHVYMSRNGL